MAEYCRQVWHIPEARPRCSGHGEPMIWEKSALGRGGGAWRCAGRRRESRRRAVRKHYEANPEKERERSRKWKAANPVRVIMGDMKRNLAKQLERDEKRLAEITERLTSR